MCAICLAWDGFRRDPTPQHGDLHAQLLRTPGARRRAHILRHPQRIVCGGKALPPQPPPDSSASVHPPIFLFVLFAAKKCIKTLFLPLKLATVSEQIKGAELRSKDVPFADFFPHLPEAHHTSKDCILFFPSPAADTKGLTLSGHTQAPASQGGTSYPWASNCSHSPVTPVPQLQNPLTSLGVRHQKSTPGFSQPP